MSKFPISKLDVRTLPVCTLTYIRYCRKILNFFGGRVALHNRRPVLCNVYKTIGRAKVRPFVIQRSAQERTRYVMPWGCYKLVSWDSVFSSWRGCQWIYSYGSCLGKRESRCGWGIKKLCSTNDMLITQRSLETFIDVPMVCNYGKVKVGYWFTTVSSTRGAKVVFAEHRNVHRRLAINTNSSSYATFCGKHRNRYVHPCNLVK